MQGRGNRQDGQNRHSQPHRTIGKASGHTAHTPQERAPSTPCLGRSGGCCGVQKISKVTLEWQRPAFWPSEKPWVPYSYAATVFFLRLPLETGASGTTVSVHGADWRYESNAVIAGMQSFFPIARQDKPS